MFRPLCFVLWISLEEVRYYVRGEIATGSCSTGLEMGTHFIFFSRPANCSASHVYSFMNLLATCKKYLQISRSPTHAWSPAPKANSLSLSSLLKVVHRSGRNSSALGNTSGSLKRFSFSKSEV